MGIPVRDLLRRKGTPYDELGLDDPALSDDELIDAMLAHPILINRPIVVTPLGREAVPSVRGRARNPARPAARRVRQGRWRGGRGCRGQTRCAARTMTDRFAQRLVAEGIGTGLLLAAVVGSGIMAEQLAGGNMAVALLANTLATAGALVALILTFGPISGAHFNPAVTVALASRKALPWGAVPGYVLAQLVGAVLGVWLAHAMFGLPLLQASAHARTGGGQWIGEFTATFALLSVIWSCTRHHPHATPYAVACIITAAYWFTSSTSFANPVVTVARALQRHVRGHPACRCACLHRRPVPRRRGSHSVVGMVCGGIADCQTATVRAI